MPTNLYSSKSFHDPISIHGMDIERLKKMLKLMLIIRKTEQYLALAKKKNFNWWTCTSWSWSRSYCSWNITKPKKNR
jgi:hypothetical protein